MNARTLFDRMQGSSANGATAAATSDSSSAPTRPAAAKKQHAYYDASRQGFWVQNSRGEWIPFTEAALRRVYKYQHFAHISSKDEQFAAIDKEFIELQKTHDVGYVGPIAGYKSGVHTICGQRVLVPTGPRLLQWKAGSWDTFKKFVEQLLGEHVTEFYGWLKCSLKTLYKGPPWRPGQMLAIAGPAGSGKSLLQNLLTEMLGGRSGKPYRYLTGETSFNSDLLSNEHLMVEDEPASTDNRVRRHFGSQLKNMIVNEVQSLHRKGRDALSVTPFWRVTITLNDEPENLCVLPPIDESLRDKITLLRAHPFTPPYDADDLDGRDRWRRTLSSELPAFMFWLRGWRIPPRMVNVRYGVRAFQDEELMAELEQMSKEIRMMQLIDTLQIWDVDRNPFEGTAAEVEERLLEKDKLGRAQKLLNWEGAAGTYLARLCHRFPDRFSSRRDGRFARKYRILPPG